MKVLDGVYRSIQDAPADCAAAGRGDSAGGDSIGGDRWAFGNRHRLRWFFSAIWLAYLIQPIAGLFGHGHGPLFIAGGLLIVAVFCTVYVAMICSWDRYPRLALSSLALIAALAVLSCVVYGADWTVLWIYVSAATGVAIAGRRPAILGVLVAGACYALLSWIAHVPTGQFLGVLLPVVLVGLMMTGFRIQIALMRELSQTRETVARLAANEERLRLARDLHDLTGHSLSLVTLKAELVQRTLDQLPASPERDRAARDVADIERVSRQTLHDIREAVSGYRRPTLAVEFAAASSALEAAGIRLDAAPGQPHWSGPLSQEREAALAWCLREAVTNVVRHSGAGTCRIRLPERDGELSLEVTDDGRGMTGLPDGAGSQGTLPGRLAGTPAPSAGSGLHGMAERLSAVGGALLVGPGQEAGPGRTVGADQAAGQARLGFQLVATVPVPAQPGHLVTGDVPSGGRAIAVTP